MPKKNATTLKPYNAILGDEDRKRLKKLQSARGDISGSAVIRQLIAEAEAALAK